MWEICGKFKLGQEASPQFFFFGAPSSSFSGRYHLLLVPKHHHPFVYKYVEIYLNISFSSIFRTESAHLEFKKDYIKWKSQILVF